MSEENKNENVSEKEEIKEEAKIEENKVEEAKTEETKTEVKAEEKEETKEDEKEESLPKSIAREIMEWILCLVIAFVLAILVKYFLFTPTLVKQSSMYPTIYDGERVFVNRLVRTFKQELHRGDIVTLEAPLFMNGDGGVKAYYQPHKGIDWILYNMVEINKTSYIKRIIGLPGDKIKIADGKVYLNDELLDESEYLVDGTETYIYPSGYLAQMPDEFVVPEGYIFAMGDNREHSRDCREFGCVPIEKVEGRVIGRIWPLDRFGAITKSDLTIDDVDDYNSGLTSAN